MTENKEDTASKKITIKMFFLNKKIFYIFFVPVFFFSMILPSKAEEYALVTNDNIIIKALDALKGTTGEWSRQAILGNNLSGKPFKISFQNIEEKLSKRHTEYDSLGWIEKGQFYIFIDGKNQKAPPEVIACLLAHEAIHQDIYNSVNEEAFGWAYEADVWIQLKAKNPELNKLKENEIPLVKRLNMLEEAFRKGNYSVSEIKLLIEKNNVYQTLPLTSYGFGR